MYDEFWQKNNERAPAYTHPKEEHQNYPLYEKEGYIRKPGSMWYTCVVEEQRAMLHLPFCTAHSSYQWFLLTTESAPYLATMRIEPYHY